jgi:uncharacterized protein (TIGR03435 family)
MRNHPSWRRLFLATAAVAALAVPILAGVLIAPRVRAQSSQTANAPLPSFEVASIKLDPSGDPRLGFISYQSPGRLTATDVTTKMIIEFAYSSKDFQLLGGPSWINSEGYDIDAKIEDSLAQQLQKLPTEQRLDRDREMVQSLLADRFKLSVTHSTRELPVYSLVVAKGGPKLKDVASPAIQANAAAPPPTSARESVPSSPPPPGRGTTLSIGRSGEARLTAKSMSIANLVDMISRQLGRPILDRTRLKGTYDFTLQYTPENPIPGLQGPDAAPPDSSGTSIFTALQEQLGLKLESTRGPVDVLVIDHVERPSEN